MTLGDNDYTERPRLFRRDWRASFGWAARDGLAVAGAFGNHDVRVLGGRYQRRLLDIPRRYYERRVGDVGLFVLDSSRIGAGQAAWLDRALGRSDAPWKVVVLHHPLFSCGAYRGTPELRRLLLPVLARNGVHLVLSGHDHNYQRFAARAGTTFVVHGGGGTRLYPLEPCPRWYPRRMAARSARGWIYLRAGEGNLRVRAVAPHGGAYDDFFIYP